MRRKDREITDFQELVRIMEQCDVCRIALNGGGFPYIVPLHLPPEGKTNPRTRCPPSAPPSK